MTREGTRRGAATALAAASLMLAGCSHGDSHAGGNAEHHVAAATSTRSAAARTSKPTATPSPTHTPGVPTPGSMEKPATSSGSLSKHSFPSPRQLGAGWRYAVDPGSAEEGYAGNGTPALARDPQEVAQAAVPIGCARPAALPVPAHALEVDYTLRHHKVIAVRGRFASPGQARAFFAGRSQALQACAGRSGSAAIGALVDAIDPLGPGAVASDRTPHSDPWREVAVLDHDSVMLVAAQGSHPLTDTQTRRLVRLVRS